MQPVLDILRGVMESLISHARYSFTFQASSPFTLVSYPVNYLNGSCFALSRFTIITVCIACFYTDYPDLNEKAVAYDDDVFPA